MEFLIQEAKRRNPDAFTELMQFYMQDMYKIALAILMNDEDAADAIQDTILSCWKNLDSLKEPRYFKTWMTMILINKSYDIRKKSQVFLQLDEYAEPAAPDEYHLEFREALDSLSERYRIIMTLFYSEDYSVKEIASLLHLPESTVRTRLQRGREKLAFYYKDSR
nr:sigma-70 family RNA polymerase sigma factor [Roseburia sp.]